MTDTFKFPKNFLWGGAISAYQAEGGNINSDYEVWGNKKGIEVAGKACDHYNRFREDIGIAKSLNHNIFRFSIEWARIEPEEGKFDRHELDHYKQVLQEIKKRGMKSVVTLYHFTLPNWVAEIGGWENPEAGSYFERYVNYIVDNLGDLMDYIITINEPFVYCLHAYLLDDLSPAKKNLTKLFKVLYTLIRVHKEVYIQIKDKVKIPIGYSKNVPYITALDKRNVFDKLMAKFLNYIFNGITLQKLSKSTDFIGLQYYNIARIKFKPGGDHLHLFNEWGLEEVERGKGVTDMGWEIYPKGIYYVLKRLKKYDLPILVTENGLADKSDKYRKDFIKNHLINVHRAISEGVNVIGYLHWSLLDNFEWKEGKSKRFGLIEIDYKNRFKRKVRSSSKYYSKIAECGFLEVYNS